MFYVDASSVETLTSVYKAIAEHYKVGNTAESAKHYLSVLKTPWLLVLDNADDPNLDLGPFIPGCQHGSVIITSRNIEVSDHASPGATILLPDLDPEDAIDRVLAHWRGSHKPTGKQEYWCDGCMLARLENRKWISEQDFDFLCRFLTQVHPRR